MKKSAVMFFLIILSVLIAGKENSYSKSIFLVSFQPYLYRQPIEESNNTAYANLLPVSLEFAITENYGLRISPIMGLKFYAYGVRFGQMGALFSLPMYYTKGSGTNHYSGYYTSGVIGGAYNGSESYICLTLANETGISFTFSKKYCISGAIQAGDTYFMFSNSELNRNTLHLGILLNIGIWM